MSRTACAKAHASFARIPKVETLKHRLEQDGPAPNYYELLELACFTDDRDCILAAVRRATRLLHQYQNHKDSTTVQRARKLQLLCATAAHTFSHANKWQAYDIELMTCLRDEFQSQASTSNLYDWLLDARRIAPHRVDDVAEFITGSVNAPSESATSGHESQTAHGSGSPGDALQNPLNHDVEMAGSLTVPATSPTPQWQQPTSGLSMQALRIPSRESDRPAPGACAPPPVPVRTVSSPNHPSSAMTFRGTDHLAEPLVNGQAPAQPESFEEMFSSLGALTTSVWDRLRPNLVLWCVTGSIFAVTMIGILFLVVTGFRRDVRRHELHPSHSKKITLIDDDLPLSIQRNLI